MNDEKQIVVEEGEQLLAPLEEEQEQDYTLPVILFFGGSVPLVALTQVLGLGMPGFIVGAVGAGILAVTGKPLFSRIAGLFPELERYKHLDWSILLKQIDGEGNVIVDADPVVDEKRAQPKDEPRAGAEPPAPSGRLDTREDTTGFVTVDRSSEVPGVPRYTVEEIAEHIQPNSYQLYVGRSLTQPNNPAISISFYRRHLKVIGASQKGKSSMAAALLKIILRTHDPEHVLIALLDIENRTSKLFENDPHIARVRFPDGKETLLHARSKEEVIEHLELLIEILNYRATMTVAQVRAQPLIVIYLEEFLLLKKELKQRAARLTGEAKERAEADYERFVFCVNQLAGRGLKYNLQLLVCAQVDYRDDDLYEAFANITAGFCFCVRATAAASAGFMQTELLNRNAKNNKVGQCVVETPDGHDLILAPEYDLEAKLTAYETRHTATHNNVAMRPVRPAVEPTHLSFYARTEQENEDDFELDDSDAQPESARINSPVRRPVDTTHTTHSDAQANYPMLNPTQIALFVTSYEMTSNIDKSLTAARADTRYREHARAIIADLRLKRKDA